jgi:tetrahydromethanopterin S-methyltransferase subunit C
VYETPNEHMVFGCFVGLVGLSRIWSVPYRTDAVGPLAGMLAFRWAYLPVRRLGGFALQGPYPNKETLLASPLGELVNLTCLCLPPGSTGYYRSYVFFTFE